MPRRTPVLGSLLVSLLVLACDNKPTGAGSSSGTPAGGDLGAMTEYMRKSKSIEAKLKLRAIARGIGFALEEGSKLASVPLTPPAGECCKHPKGACPAGTGDWTQPGWQAILFELLDPHYYSYELVVEPSGFIARAVGDLDCDGDLATFELRGTARPDGTYEIAPEPTSDKALE